MVGLAVNFQGKSDSTMVAPPIVLTTDFGAASPYAGVLHGVVLRINPSATIVDLTHQIQSQNIRQGSFILGTNYRFFPEGSIHVAVVDPGVGTNRKPLLVVTPTARFLAPDNGLLSSILSDHLREIPRQSGLVPLPPDCAAYYLTNSRYWLNPVSHTFHGRDIFAPVAAYLSLGVSPDQLGEPAREIVWLPTPQPARHGANLTGEILYIDHFGNLVTNIPVQELADAATLEVEIKGHRINQLSRTFHHQEPGQAGALLALVGSHGYLEIAVTDGSAASYLGANTGEPVRVSGLPAD